MNLDTFAPATAMLEALHEGRISAVELLDLHLRRIERYNPPLNAIIAIDPERARREAAEADRELSRGAQKPLLGLPITIKDSIDVAGMRTVCGIEARATVEPAGPDAPVVARLRGAGDVVMGKKNTPPGTADWQTDNPVFGRTNNPWDLSRTPGGSSGGAAAAVAAGLSPLDIGSDIGGSIRMPAVYCGIFGHRPSDTAVPRSGHFPGSPLPNAARFMNVLGPLARSAEDLDLALSVIAGPEAGEDVAWRLQLPAPRHGRLSDFRVAILPRLDWRPVDEEIAGALDRAAGALRRSGARVREALPESFGDLREYSLLYNSALSLMFQLDTPRQKRFRDAEKIRGRSDDPLDLSFARAMDADAAEYLDWHRRREEYREAYRRFFREWDILLAPVTLTPAIPHTPGPQRTRAVDVDGEAVRYDLQALYPGIATFAGQPATAFPVSLSGDGLPLGLQAIGPYLEDRTTIRFAGLLSEELGGFRAPPGFDAEGP